MDNVNRPCQIYISLAETALYKSQLNNLLLPLLLVREQELQRAGWLEWSDFTGIMDCDFSATIILPILDKIIVSKPF